MRRDPFQAIADPTRREIIDILVEKPLTLNTIAQQFSISRPAISKHVKILEESGVVSIRKAGRERFCHVEFEVLKEVADWINTYEQFWIGKMDDLETHLKNRQKT